MRNPRFWRSVALAFFVSGLFAAPAAFLLPEAVAGDTPRGILFIYGVMALLFGGGTALFRHFDVRAQEALARGEDIIARWRVDAATWRAFVAHNHQLHQDTDGPYNELSIRDEVPDGGIEVVVGKAAVQVGDSIHALPRRGTPEVTHAELNTSRVRPSYIEFQLYYPGGGHGASGVPRPPTRTLLRFPVAPNALREAERTAAYYRSGRPGEPDFFHGRGDGSDAEDVSRCWSCGYETHKLVSHCPQCGASMQSRRWSRRFGVVLLLCGIFITGVMGAVLYYTAPLLLRPGVSINGTRFSGSAGQSVFILGILSAVATFGVTAMLYGIWQIKTGQRSRKVVGFLIGIAALLVLVSVFL